MGASNHALWKLGRIASAQLRRRRGAMQRLAAVDQPRRPMA
ncbi:hypothetical protein HMPREF0185_01314 [Brevundimonas diminuta 470-4]|nr:hypothetical protein HMPREF0185_01314 [Brevundimonas diminuta 470-4]